MNFQTLNLSIIRFLAQQRGMSLTEVADRAGIGYTGIAKILRENSTSMTTLEALSRALDVPLQYFFMTESEVIMYADFSLEKFKEFKEENEKLKKEISDLKDKIIRLSDRLL